MHESSTIKRFPPQLPVKQIATAAQALIDLLDALGGDPELEVETIEANGDELDQAWIEWDRMRGSQKRGPNIIAGHEDDEDSDPAELDDEDRAAWIERVDQRQPPLPIADCPADYRNSEDAEEDDGDGECTDDIPGFDERSRLIANGSATSPGCSISDPDGEHDGREVETWSHWLDHASESHIGKRPGWNDGPEAA